MDELLKIIDKIISGGIVTFLLVLVFLLVQNPDRAEKLKELLLLPWFRFFRIGVRQYVSSTVSYATTTFLKQQVNGLISSAAPVKLRIRWVNSPKDPALHRDGSLVLFLRETNDQSRNILSATQVALPRVICAMIRSRMLPVISQAIDLTLLKKLADSLGKHALPVYQKYFLDPGIAEHPSLPELFKQLVELDSNGIFVPVFLEELNLLGDYLHASGDTADKTIEIMDFLKYLLAEAHRDIQEEIPLDHFSRQFKVGIVLLAISTRMKREGLAPYVKRVDQKIRLGCDSIYVIAYSGASQFFQRLLRLLEGDNRISLSKRVEVKCSDKSSQVPSKKSIALFQRTAFLADTSYADRIRASEIRVGEFYEGEVLDVSDENALVDIRGINAIIYKSECSWQSVTTCSATLLPKQRYQFRVKHIDTNRSFLELTLRDPARDPWKSPHLPSVGESIDVTLTQANQYSFLGMYRDGIEIVIPRTELSWDILSPPRDDVLLNTTQRIIIFESINESRSLKGSIRRLTEDPWPQIHKKLPKGTELHAIVAEVTPHFVRVNLPGGLQGIIPKEAMTDAGYEYQDFTINVVLGQGLDVVVTKVFLEKRKIRLNLKRNLANR